MYHQGQALSPKIFVYNFISSVMEAASEETRFFFYCRVALSYFRLHHQSFKFWWWLSRYFFFCTRFFPGCKSIITSGLLFLKLFSFPDEIHFPSSFVHLSQGKHSVRKSPFSRQDSWDKINFRPQHWISGSCMSYAFSTCSQLVSLMILNLARLFYTMMST